MDAKVVNGAVEFAPASFSVFVITSYTVDFHWGEYAFNLAGGSKLPLSRLLRAMGGSIAGRMPKDSAKLIGLADDMGRIDSVAFSDPALVRIEQKRTRAGNDWLLTSLAPFDTEETLTIRLKDGGEIVIHVTDAPLAQEEGAIYTVTYNANGGAFANNETSNTMTYRLDKAVENSHTPNIWEDGTQNGNYANSYVQNEVVKIDGAQKLEITIIYGGESVNYDWVCAWDGQHPDYTAANHHGSSFTGKLGGGSHTAAANTKLYTRDNQDTVTFAYKTDGSGCGDGYGYYAVVRGLKADGTPVYRSNVSAGTYKQPVKAGETFVGWYTDEALTQPFDPAALPEEDSITVYAKYEAVDAVARVRSDAASEWTGFNDVSEAIAYANTLSGRVEIEIAKAGTYPLSNGYTINSAITSLSLRFASDGTCELVKAQKTAPMFTVTSGTTSVNVSGIHFNGGGTAMQTSANGGIFNIQGENAVFDDCVFTDCYVKDNQSSTPGNGANARSNGAAIAHYSASNVNGTLTIRNCRFENCNAQSYNSNDVGNQALGGAVFFRRINLGSRLLIEGTSFTGCKSDRHAGAVFIQGASGKVQINNCSFDHCTVARGGGGAIYSEAMHVLSIAGSTFTSCDCKTNGGTVYAGGPARIVDSTFTDSSATTGGTVYVSGDIIITDSAFNGSSSTSTGGAVHGTGLITVRTTAGGSTEFSDCTASGLGGALYTTNAGEFTLTNAGGSMSFLRCISTGNQGGAIHSLGNMTVTNSDGGTILFADCHADKSDGGAISTEGKPLTVNNSGTIRFENCSGYTGGAICTHQNVNFTLNNNTADSAFECVNCTGVQQSGGVWTGNFIANSNKGRILFDGCVSKDTNPNNAGAGAGAIYARAVTITNVEGGSASFINCSATKGNGGAILVNKVDTFTGSVVLSGTPASPITFANCTAPNGMGGAIYQSLGAQLSLSNVTMTGNSARAGGAVYTETMDVRLRNTVSITDGSLTNVTAANGGGICLKNDEAIVTIESDTDTANITINGSKTSDGKNSNVYTGRLIPPFEIKSNALTGEIGVVNAATTGLWFGRSTASNVCGNDDALAAVFLDDAGEYTAGYNGSKHLYWQNADEPVCKITDADGNLLYINNKEAVFTALAAAFGAIEESIGDANLFTDADGGAAVPRNIEMLVDNCIQGATLRVPNRALTLKTASASPADGKRPGTGSRSVIKRGDGFAVCMYMMDGTDDFTLEDIIIDGNNVLVSNYSGAIIRAADGTNCKITLKNTELKNGKTSYNGAAIHNAATGGSVTLIGSKLENFTATQNGGAVYLADKISFTMTDSEITGCSSAINGGGVYLAGGTGAVTLENSTISDCTVANNSTSNDYNSACGGAIYSLRNGMTIRGCTFRNDTVYKRGGAISYVGNGTLGIYGTVFENCATTNTGDNGGTGFGGAIFIGTSTGSTSSTLIISDNNGTRTTFTDIHAGRYGGAIMSRSTGAHTIEHTDFQNCDLDVGRGGAFYTDVGIGNLVFTDCTFDACKTGTGATATGGAIDITNATNNGFTLNDCTFTNCEAVLNGAAVYSQRNFTINGGSFTGNTVTGPTAGGAVGIHDNGATLTFKGGPVVQGNTWNGHPCNVFLNRNADNYIIANGLTDATDIGVYVNDSYFGYHGQAGRSFARYTGEAVNLDRLVSDREQNVRGEDLRGTAFAGNKIAWQGEPLVLTVVKTSDKTTPVVGARFTIERVGWNDSVTKIFSGVTGADGKVTIPWQSGALPGEDPAVTGDGGGCAFAWDEKYILRETETEDGYTLPGGYWSITTGAVEGVTSKTIQVPGQISTPDIEMEGRLDWKTVNRKELTITYDLQEGAWAAKPEQVQEFDPPEAGRYWQRENSSSEAVLIPAEAPTKSGYRFLGWNSKMDGTGNAAYQPGDTIKLGTESEITLYAIWVEDSYVARVIANDGTVTYHEALVGDTSVTYEGKSVKKGAFNYANTLTGKVTVELIKTAPGTNGGVDESDQYVLTGKFDFNKSGLTSLTIRTMPGIGFTSTIRKNHTSSLINVTANIGNLYVENVIFDGNSKASNVHGGIFNIVNAHAVFTDCEFKNALIGTGYSGAAIYVSAARAKLEIYGSTFENCKTQSSTSNGSSGQAIGGAVYFSSNDDFGQLIIDRSESGRTQFTDCFANRYGGAVGVNYKSKSMTIKHTDFRSCTANRYHGGGVYSESANNTLVDCTFENCSSTVNSGGAVYVQGKLTIGDSGFTSCTAAVNGGAIFHTSATDVTVTDSDFTDCAGNNGSGVYIDTNTSGRNVTFERCDFTRCNSRNGYGAICESSNNNIRAANTTIRECTFTDCKSTSWAGALILRSKHVVLEDCDFIRSCGNASGGEGASACSVYISNYDATGTINVLRCHFDNDGKGLVNGGALHVDRSIAALNIVDSVFENAKSTGSGGAVYAMGKLTVSNSIFTSCTATGNGGAIFHTGATDVIVTDSSFTDCVGSNGSGVYIETNTTARNVTFERCALTRCNSNNGYGAICEYAGSNGARAAKTTVRECTFTDCKSTTYAGAMILRSTNVDIEDCDFIRCCGKTSGDEGTSAGSVYISNATGTVNVVRCYFDNDGKGMYSGAVMYLEHAATTLNILGSVFENAKSTGNGGAVYANAATTNISKSTVPAVVPTAGTAKGREAGEEIRSGFNNCTTTLNGGAVYATSVLKVSDTDFVDTWAKTNGGAIYRYGTDSIAFTVRNCTFDGHQSLDANTVNASNGGAIYVYNGCLEMYDSTFVDCTASSKGGALSFDAGGSDRLTVEGCTFIGRDTLTTQVNAPTEGGAIRINANSGITIKTSSFRDFNVSPTSGNGGAIWSEDPITQMQDVAFYGCTAATGGAVFSTSSITITGTSPEANVFEDCHSLNGAGGAIRVNNAGAAMNISNARFGALDANGDVDPDAGCTATTGGGAVYYKGWDGGSTSLTNCQFYGCEAENNGGAFWLHDKATNLTVTDSVFKGCKANGTGDNGRGGAVYTSSGRTLTFRNTTLENCFANTDGGALYGITNANAQLISLENCSVSGNSANRNGGGIYSNAPLTLKSGTRIEGNTASGPVGGAVNLASGRAVTFEGDVYVYDNTDALNNPRNVVLDENTNTKINVSSNGLTEDAVIGVYVTDSFLESRGSQNMNFGARPKGYEDNLDAFRNDRNPLVGGEGSTETAVAWANAYKLILDPNGGEGTPISVVLTYFKDYTLGEPYTKEGYFFAGWNTRKDGTGDSYMASDIVNQLTEEDGGEVTLYAQWEEYDPCIIRFHPNGGAEVPVRTVKPGTKLGLLPSSEREHYTFVRWMLVDENGQEQSYSQNTVVDKDMDFYAVWQRRVTVTFDPQGGIVGETEREFTPGPIGSLPKTEQPAATKKDYEFVRWYRVDEEGEKTTVTDKTAFEEDETIFAEWQVIKRRLVYYTGGGYPGKNYATNDYWCSDWQTDLDAIKSFEVTWFPEVTNNGYTLDGWYAGNTKVEPGDAVNLQEVSYLSARWTPTERYTVTFDSNGGSACPAVSVIPNSRIDRYPEPTKSGCDFAGWFLVGANGELAQDGDGALIEVSSRTPITESITVRAAWDDMATVRFDSDGGSACDAVLVKKGSRIATMPKPTRSASTFLGWYLAEGDAQTGYVIAQPETEVNNRTIITGDMTLKAKWAPNVTVTFNWTELYENDAPKVTTQSVVQGQALGKLPSAYRSTAVLEGWYPNADYSGEALTIETPINADCTYYAKWTPSRVDFSSPVSYDYAIIWTNDSTATLTNENDTLSWFVPGTQTGTVEAHADVLFNLTHTNGIIFPQDSISVTVPKYVFEDWNGNPIHGSNNIVEFVPKMPKKTSLGWYYEDAGDYYILRNSKELDNAHLTLRITYKASIQDVNAVRFDNETHRRLDKNGEFLDNDGYQPRENVYTISIKSRPADNVNVTHSKSLYTAAYKTYTRTTFTASFNTGSAQWFRSWNDAWGEKPADADKYFYVKWTHGGFGVYRHGDFNASTSGRFTTTSREWVPDGYEVVYETADYAVTRHLYSEVTGNHIWLYRKETARGEWTANHEPETGSGTISCEVDLRVFAPGTSTQGSSSVTKISASKWHYFGTAYPTAAGQDKLLDDETVSDTFHFSMSGPGEENLVQSGDSNLYHATPYTMTMRDGDRGDVSYSSKTTGRQIALGDNDYRFTRLTVSLSNADGYQDEYGWHRLDNTAYSSWKPVEVWLRRAGKTVYYKYTDIYLTGSNTNKTISLPDDTVGYELRHSTSYWSTTLNGYVSIQINPSAHVKGLVQPDYLAKETSYFYNRAVFRMTRDDTGDNMMIPVTDSDNAFAMTKSKTGLAVSKTVGSPVNNRDEGTQTVDVTVEAYHRNNANRVKPIYAGTFYELLPVGTTVDESKVSVKAGQKLSRSMYNIEFIDNWKETGQTMMKVSVGLPDTIRSSSIQLKYTVTNTNANIQTNGHKNLFAPTAFANTSSVREKYEYAPIKISELSTIPNGTKLFGEQEAEYGQYIAYANGALNFLEPNVFASSFGKYVRTLNTFVTDAEIIADTVYWYRMEYGQSLNFQSDQLVIYDHLDRGTVDSASSPWHGRSSEWRGELLDIRIPEIVSSFNDKVCAPVIYYTTVETDNPQTLVSVPFTDESVWSTEKPTGEITAFAVDFTRDTEGGSFVLKGNDTAMIDIKMKSPADVNLDNKLAINTGIATANLYPVGQESSRGTKQNIKSQTTLLMKPVVPDITLSASPASGTADEPALMAYQDTLEYEISVHNPDTDFSYRNILIDDILPTDSVALEESGIYVYVNDEKSSAVKLGNSSRVSLTKDENGKLQFKVHELIPGETLHIVMPCMVTTREGVFENQAALTGVNALPQSIATDKTYHEVKKYDVAFGKKILGAEPEQFLSGADMVLLDGSGQIADRWTSGGDYHTVRIGAGEYSLNEASAPDDYAVADSIRFTLSRDGQLTLRKQTTPLAERKIDMFDKYISVNAVIENRVSGEDADPNKEFSYTVELTGLKRNKTYTTSTGETFTTNRYGDAELSFTLKGGESLTLEKLPTGAHVTVTQKEIERTDGKDYSASYTASVEKDGTETLLHSGETYLRNQELTTQTTEMDIDQGVAHFRFENRVVNGLPVRVIVLDSEDDTPVAGAELKITGPDPAPGEERFTDEWTSTGQYKMIFLPFDAECTLEQLSATEEYTRRETPLTLTVSGEDTLICSDGSALTQDENGYILTIRNLSRAKLTVENRSRDFDFFLKGASIELLRGECIDTAEVVKSWVSEGDRGEKLYLDRGETYFVRKTASPDNHEALEPTAMRIAVDADAKLTVSLVDLTLLRSSVYDSREGILKLYDRYVETLTITNTVAAPDTSPVFHFVLAGLNPGETYRYKRSDGTEGTLSVDSEGSAIFTLNHGEKIVIKYLPHDLTVTEVKPAGTYFVTDWVMDDGDTVLDPAPTDSTPRSTASVRLTGRNLIEVTNRPCVAVVRSKTPGGLWGDWVGFEFLMSDTQGETGGEQGGDPETPETPRGAFDYANSLSGDVEIRTLLETHEQYTLQTGFVFDNQDITSLTIRSDPALTEAGKRSTLVCGTADTMLTFRTGNEATVKNMEFDGNDFEQRADGGAVSVESGSLTLSNTNIHDFTTTGVGGGAYVGENAELTVSGGEITGCSSSGENGGAVNIGAGGKVFFEGDAVVSGNKDSSGAEKNVVLDRSDTSVIGTTATGLGEDARIGVYVTGDVNDDPYLSCGGEGGDFGTFTVGGDANLDRFRNDRNSMVGEEDPDNYRRIRWHSYACKITDKNDNLLYYKVGDTFKEAVFDELDDAFANLDKLYTARSDDAVYTPTDAEHIAQIKMLKDEFQQQKQIAVNNPYHIRLTMADADDTDGYPFTGEADKATIRAWDGNSNHASLFALSNGAQFTVSNLVIDGNEARGRTTNVNGGLFTVSGTSKAKTALTLEDGAVLQNNKGTSGVGGAVYLGNYTSLTMGNATVQGCTATKGGGVYADGASSSVTMTDGALVTGNRLTTAEVKDGAGVYMSSANITVGGSATITGNSVADRTVTEDGTVTEDEQTFTVPGEASNLRLNGTNNASHITLASDLTGEIGVCNAGSAGFQFGAGSASGLKGQGRFTDDVNGMIGVLKPDKDPSGTKIYWEMEPVCRLTTPDGQPLYTRDGGDLIPCEYTNFKAAMNDVQSSKTFYTENGEKYTAKDYNIEFFVPEYSFKSSDRFDGSLKANVKITTADKIKKNGAWVDATEPTVLKRGTCDNNFIRLTRSDYTMTMENIVLDGMNRPSHGLGALVHLYLGKFVLGEGAVIRNGYSTTHCGGIDVDGGTLTIDGGTISNCFSESHSGAIHIHNHHSTSVTFKSGTIENCFAQTYGGAIYAERLMDFQGGTINNCRAGKDGGAIYIKDDGTVTLGTGSSITDCRAKNGGAVYMASGKLTMQGSGLIDGCSATDRGGAIVQENGVMNLRDNAVIRDCTAGSTGAVYIGNGTRETEHLTNDADRSWNNNWARDRRNVVVNIAGSPQVIENNGRNIDLSRITETGGNFNEVINATGMMTGAQVGLTITNTAHDDGGETFGTTVQAAANAGLSGFKNDVFTQYVGWPVTAGQAGSSYWAAPITVSAKTVDGGTVTDIPGSEGLFAPDMGVTELSATDKKFGLPAAYAKVNSAVKACQDNPDIAVLETRVDDVAVKALKYSPLSGNWQYTVNGTDWVDLDAANQKVAILYAGAICKIVDKNGTEIPFASLNSAVEYARKYSEAYSGGVCEIQMLRDYEMPASDRVTLLDDDRIVLTTAPTAAEDTGSQWKLHYTGSSATGTPEPGAKATITRGFDGGSMFVNRGTLTLTDITLDGAKQTHTSADNGGIVYQEAGILNITTGASLQNAQAANGGAVYVKENAVVNLNAGTITGNTCTGDGAGIYLEEDSTLNLSGSPAFAGSYTGADGTAVPSLGNFKTGTTDQLTGGEAYPKPDGTNPQVRQDIFIAGYNGTVGGDGPDRNDPKKATSLVVNGKLDSGEGSVWIWADTTGDDAENNHYGQLKQFAKFSSEAIAGLTEEEKIAAMKTFRNAVSDDLTGSSEVLLGEFCEDDSSCISWSGVKGTRKVILRKVNSGHAPLSGKKFAIYKGTSDTAFQGLSDLTTGSSGYIWIGELPYGWYILEETNPHRFFWIVVSESGAYVMPYRENEAVGGYTDRADAEAAARAKYDEVK